MTKQSKIAFFFFKNSLRLGKKQLRKPTTIISFAGFALSVAVLTASLTLLNGYQKTLKEGLLGVNAHLFLYGMRNDRLGSADIDKISSFLESQPEVVSFSPVMMTQVMAVAESQVKGVIARSIDWQQESIPIEYWRFISQGSGELPEVYDAVVGSDLADHLQVKVGDRISLLSPANTQYTIFGLKSGEVLIRIKGIFHSGIYDTDSRTIFLNKEVFPLLVGEGSHHDLVEVKLRNEDINRADYLAYLWNVFLENEFLIYSWIDFNGNLFSMLVLQRWVIAIILSFLILIASFSIISNTSTSILEKKKEIAILKATGCQDGIIKTFFLGRTAILSFIAILTGIGGGLLLAYLLTKQTFLTLKGDVYFIEQFSIQPDLSTFLIILCISLLISLWAASLSLRKLAQLTIIETIRGN